MEYVNFSLDELEKLTKKQLRILLGYYAIEYPKKSTKAVMVKLLDNYYRPKFVVKYTDDGEVGFTELIEEVGMSVRVRRIKEAGNGA